MFEKTSTAADGYVLTFATGPGGQRPEAGEDRLDPTHRSPAVAFSRSAAHTGTDVGAWAIGPGADAVRGTIENSDIGRILFEAMGLE